jgi:hypothetical protein
VLRTPLRHEVGHDAPTEPIIQPNALGAMSPVVAVVAAAVVVLSSVVVVVVVDDVAKPFRSLTYVRLARARSGIHHEAKRQFVDDVIVTRCMAICEHAGSV